MDYKKVKKVIDENMQKIRKLEDKKVRLLKEFRVLADQAKLKQIRDKLNQ